MTRKNIFEILNEKYNFKNELDKISILFNNPIISHSYPLGLGRYKTEYYTFEKMVEDVFHDWKGRVTCISPDNMRKEIGINEILNKTDKKLEDILICLEYFENIFHLFMGKVASTLEMGEYASYNLLQNFHLYRSNTDTLLNHMNYQKYIIRKDEQVILIPENPAATAVAEISSEETAIAIMKYHHASLKGKLEEKRDLLRRIAKEYEPLLDNPIDGFTEYFKTARNMLNNLDIRHNNKSGKKKNDLVTNLTSKELEKWYDELYQLLLFCVLAKDNKERKDKMAEFLKGLKEKK